MAYVFKEVTSQPKIFLDCSRCMIESAKVFSTEGYERTKMTSKNIFLVKLTKSSW